METMNEISGYMSTTSDDQVTSKQSTDKNINTHNSTIDTDEDNEDDNDSNIPYDTASQMMEDIHVNSAMDTNKKISSYTNSDKTIDIKRFDFIPLRLNDYERKLLQVLENALDVCEYTDVVDVTFSHTRKSKQSRILESLVDVLSISCGLIMSNNLSKGEQLISGKSFNDNVPLFAEIFEIGRRYKIMNPSKMRDTYGKLMYILMDTESYQIKSDLKITFVKPILTVSTFLYSRQEDHLPWSVKDILQDPLWLLASRSISNDCKDKTKRELMNEQEEKLHAEKLLLKKYTCDQFTSEEVHRIIDSIADNEAYLSFNRTPVNKIIEILKDSFDPRVPVDPFSLHLTSKGFTKKIFNSFSSLYSSGGYSSSFMGSGACLSHDHATQFKFVLQSFTLWREIMANMPKLWLLADADITKEAYRLVDTGQGYQRLQSSPRIRNEMSRILSLVQSQTGSWVGLSVVHLGDRDVPNALVFIDKYTQVPRILAPIVQCIQSLPRLVEDTAFHTYVSQEWGSIDGLRMQILSDFFKHGFDGSGDDGGSCIDGRLTSAWNWCSKLHKKPYYYVFMFTGFQGFDGDWKEN